ncbi:MAG: sugar ABC transporter ATP-binding protein, partial [Planctomycetota bacterium]
MTEPLPSNPEPLLVMHGVRKRFGGVQALRGVSLEVSPGEVHALVGENGAGKSTLMKVLSGVERPDAGEMSLGGRPWRPSGPVDARRGGIAMIHQELALAPHLSVAENIALGVEPSRLPWFGRISPSDRRGMLATARRVMGRLGHGDLDPARRTGDLPAAVRQLVEIGRALATDASVVVMDEPTSSLGRRDADLLLDIVGRLRDEGIAIVYISHFLEEIRRVADRFTVIRDGSTVTSGRMADERDETLVEHMIGRPLDAVFPPGGREAGEIRLEARSIAGHGLPVEASLDVRSGEILGIAGLVGAGRTELLRCLAGLDATVRGDVSIHGRKIHRSTSIRKRMRAGVGFVSEDRKGEGLALPMSVGENLLLPRLGPVTSGGVLSSRRMDATAGRWLS